MEDRRSKFDARGTIFCHFRSWIKRIWGKNELIYSGIWLYFRCGKRIISTTENDPNGRCLTDPAAKLFIYFNQVHLFHTIRRIKVASAKFGVTLFVDLQSF